MSTAVLRQRANLALAIAFALTASGAASAVSLTGTYAENFDSMGTLGTAPPTGWVVKTGNTGTTNGTWTSTIVANGANSVASMINTAGALTAITTPTTTNNNGFNAARSAGATADRVLATSPTTVSGAALELSLTNNTAGPLTALGISFDTVRYNAANSANELPGFQIFYSTGSNVWTNVSALNPTLATVPNTVGVTSAASFFSLASSVPVGGTLLIRWVDDNALQTSPDQIIGLNNVSISAVPVPAALPLLASALGGFGFLRRSRKAA